jgi:hypothetical protein
MGKRQKCKKTTFQKLPSVGVLGELSRIDLRSLQNIEVDLGLEHLSCKKRHRT